MSAWIALEAMHLDAKRDAKSTEKGELPFVLSPTYASQWNDWSCSYTIGIRVPCFSLAWKHPFLVSSTLFALHP